MLPLLALAAALQAPPPPEPQGVEYRIEARLDEATHVLHGRARLRYTNHSGSRLDTLWFHQHLNAFRPNSAWARRELNFGERRFQDLGPDDHAYERFTHIEVGGRPVVAVYPGAPDSTVAGVPLPEPLAPGATVEVRMEWDARAATTPRRQGRRGREYDWAHWYPRIAVFEDGRWRTHPLQPQGEFYGEFASYDVTLDVPDDQVIGATGVPVEGDPGWARVAAPGTGEIAYRRDAYSPGAAEPLGLLGAPEPRRRQVRWRAERVHHFAWATSPDFAYEQVVWRGLPIHVLYRAAQAREWGGGIVAGRAVAALEWLDFLFGAYAYPQFTVVPRIESPGATEYPMLVMNGTPSQGALVHEAAHQYAHALLASNEWRSAWLDEGLASFVTNWFWESRGEDRYWRDDMDAAVEVERAGLTQPLATPADDFDDMATYVRMTYTKGAVVLRMLRELVGPDAMRAILREYYRANAFRHVDEAELRAAVEAVTGRSYDWFFETWVHTTARLDYGIGRVSSEPTADGRWRTRVEVLRRGEAWMPVKLQVGSETRTLTSRARMQVPEVITDTRPQRVVLDPDDVLLDVEPANDARSLEG